MTLLKTVSVAFSCGILILFMNMSLLISRPATEKMYSNGLNVAGTARTRMAIIEILEYFVSFFFSTILKGPAEEIRCVFDDI